MRLLIEGTPQEFVDKNDDLVKALVAKLQFVSPELSEHLAKSLPNKEPALKFRALEQMRRRTSAAYQDMLDAMVQDIEKVLDTKISKAVSQVSDSEVGEEADDPDYTEEGDPIFNDQGETPTEEKERVTKEGPEEKDDDEDIEKSGGPYLGPRGGKWADVQHKIPWKDGGGLPRVSRKQAGLYEVEHKGVTYEISKEEGREGVFWTISRGEVGSYGKPGWEPGAQLDAEDTKAEAIERIRIWGESQSKEGIKKSGLATHVNDVFDRESVAYNRIKRVLKKKGYLDSDFDEGGPLYGYSVNELLGLLKSTN